MDGKSRAVRPIPDAWTTREVIGDASGILRAFGNERHPFFIILRHRTTSLLGGICGGHSLIGRKRFFDAFHIKALFRFHDD
jgi:hypothetical protein